MGVLLDVTPLRTSSAYRKLYLGTSLTAVGNVLAATTISLQVFDLTGSSFQVGLVGLFGLIPLVVTGLYGGAIVDAYDRRTVALWGSVAMWLTAGLNLAQALAGNRQTWVLFALVALNTAAFGVVSPARAAIYPRILQPRELPAANALMSLAMSGSVLIGPVLAGVLVGAFGYAVTYAIDVVMFVFAMWGIAALPPIPPGADAGRPAGGMRDEVAPEATPPAVAAARGRVPGIRSVVDGFRYLATRPNIRMTFLTDFCAMILANPIALLPAVAVVGLSGGPETVGVLTAGTAAGALLMSTLSGRLPGVRWQGRAVVGAVSAWGVSVIAFGLVVLAAQRGLVSPAVGLALAFLALALAGASDTVSMVFRNTILQTAATDQMRGRLQGIFIVVVAGGPRLGQFLLGSLAAVAGEWGASVIGGIACVIGVNLLARLQGGFLRYDAENPVP